MIQSIFSMMIESFFHVQISVKFSGTFSRQSTHSRMNYPWELNVQMYLRPYAKSPPFPRKCRICEWKFRNVEMQLRSFIPKIDHFEFLTKLQSPSLRIATLSNFSHLLNPGITSLAIKTKSLIFYGQLVDKEWGRRDMKSRSSEKRCCHSFLIDHTRSSNFCM